MPAAAVLKFLSFTWGPAFSPCIKPLNCGRSSVYLNFTIKELVNEIEMSVIHLKLQSWIQNPFSVHLEFRLGPEKNINGVKRREGFVSIASFTTQTP